MSTPNNPQITRDDFPLPHFQLSPGMVLEGTARELAKDLTKLARAACKRGDLVDEVRFREAADKYGVLTQTKRYQALAEIFDRPCIVRLGLSC